MNVLTLCGQLPLFTPDAAWRTPRLADLPADWSRFSTIGIDIETRDPELKKTGIGVRREGYIVGVSFATEAGSYYLPIRHGGGDNMDETAVLGYLREQAARFTGTVVGTNINYDLDYLMEEGVEFGATWFRDVMLNEVLLDELRFSYSLAAVAKAHGLKPKAEDTLREAAAAYDVDPKGGMWALPARFVGEYAEHDAALPVEIWERQRKEIIARGLVEVANLEARCIMPLLKMRRRGVRIDTDRLSQLHDWFHTKEREAYEQVRQLTGFRIGDEEVWKARSLEQVLRAEGLDIGKTETGAPEITREVLASAGAVGEAIATAREMNKFRTTFVKSIRNHMTNGRLHCTFNQMAREADDGKGTKGVRFGRMSCQNPNMQQQPARGKFANMWREIYLPEDGDLWACCDYSQQEPRWTTYFAAAHNMDGAQKAVRAYVEDPDLDNHDFMSKLTGLDRKAAKQIFLGLCYGQGGAKLCDMLGLPTEYREHWSKEPDRTYRAAGREGQAIIDQFDGRAPYVRKLARFIQNRAKSQGYITTIGGRRLHFPGGDWTHKALNRLIQGSAADQAKAALVLLDQAGFKLMLQVHDEFDLSVSSREEGEKAAALMRTAHHAFKAFAGTGVDDASGSKYNGTSAEKARKQAAEIPFKVDVEVGPNWGKVK